MDGTTGNVDNIAGDVNGENRSIAAKRASAAISIAERIRAKIAGSKREVGSDRSGDSGAKESENGQSAPGPAEPAEAAGPAPDTKTRRGRPVGSRTKNRVSIDDEQVSPKFFAKQILVTHQFLAIILQAPEFVLSDDEAATLSTALLDVRDHYGVKVSKGPILLFTLVTTLLTLYFPRLIALNARMKQKTAEMRANRVANPGPVVPGSAGPAASPFKPIDFSNAA